MHLSVMRACGLYVGREKGLEAIILWFLIRFGLLGLMLAALGTSRGVHAVCLE